MTQVEAGQRTIVGWSFSRRHQPSGWSDHSLHCQCLPPLLVLLFPPFVHDQGSGAGHCLHPLRIIGPGSTLKKIEFSDRALDVTLTNALWCGPLANRVQSSIRVRNLTWDESEQTFSWQLQVIMIPIHQKNVAFLLTKSDVHGLDITLKSIYITIKLFFLISLGNVISSLDCLHSCSPSAVFANDDRYVNTSVKTSCAHVEPFLCLDRVSNSK